MNNSLIYPDAPRCPVAEDDFVIPEWLDRSWKKEWDSPLAPQVVGLEEFEPWRTHLRGKVEVPK